MADLNGAVVLPRSLPKKAKAAVPGSTQDSGALIPRQDTQLIFETVRQLPDGGRKVEAIRKLARVDGTVSAAVYALVQNAMSGYTLKAYATGTHEFDPQGTQLVRSVAASMDTLYDYTKGFADKKTIDAAIETGLREVVETGAFAAELVLGEMALPDRIHVVPYEDLQWKKRSKGLYPVQKSGGGEIDLNIPTFWVAESHKEANQAYTYSMLEGALNTAFYFSEFIEDMRRAVRRSGHARIIVKLDAEKVRAAAAPDVVQDPEKLTAYMEKTRDDVVSIINALEPDDALVGYDSAEIDSISAEGEKMDYKDLLAALSGMLATSLKTHPSVIGLRLAGSQSLSNTESLIFLKVVRSIQVPVEEVMSRAMTLATRLYGADVYVKFEFKPIDLRPETELAAFKIMDQDRILEQLSLGFISDEEAAEALGTGTRPAGAPPLSGTFFKDTKGPDINADNASPNNDPMGNALQPDTPKKSGGADQ